MRFKRNERLLYVSPITGERHIVNYVKKLGPARPKYVVVMRHNGDRITVTTDTLHRCDSMGRKR